MTIRASIAEAVRNRRLSLAWMDRGDRRRARLGLAGATLSGAGVMAAGLGQPARTVTTPLGDYLVLDTWVPALAYMGLAVTSLLLLRAQPDTRRNQVVIGAAIVVIAATIIESLRAIDAGLDGFHLPLAAARLMLFAALGTGLTVMLARSQRTRPGTIEMVAAAGFLLMLAGHATALLSDGRTDGIIRGQLTQSLLDSASQASSWLLLFTAWQIIEGLHASVDSSRVGMKRVRSGWLRRLVLGKLALVVVGFAVLAPEAYPDWERARIADPFGWGWALVIAVAAVVWVRQPGVTRPDRRTALRTAVAVIAIWSAPYLIGFALVAAGWVALLVIPSSIADVVAWGMTLISTAVLVRWLGRRPVPAWSVGVLLAAGAATVWIAPTTAGWLDGLQSAIVDFFVRAADGISDADVVIQVVLLLLLPLGAAVWLARFDRTSGVAVALLAVGLWIVPRAVDVYAVNVAGVDDFPLIAPTLLMLDVALTVTVAAHLVGRNRTDDATDRNLGLLVTISTVVTYGTQFAEPLVDWLAEVGAGAVGVDATTLSFVVFLVLPGLYAVMLDAKELNRKRSTEDVLKTLGTSCLVFAVAVPLIALGEITADDQSSTLVRTLVLPGLVLVAALSTDTDDVAVPEPA